MKYIATAASALNKQVIAGKASTASTEHSTIIQNPSHATTYLANARRSVSPEARPNPTDGHRDPRLAVSCPAGVASRSSPPFARLCKKFISAKSALRSPNSSYSDQAGRRAPVEMHALALLPSLCLSSNLLSCKSEVFGSLLGEGIVKYGGRNMLPFGVALVYGSLWGCYFAGGSVHCRQDVRKAVVQALR